MSYGEKVRPGQSVNIHSFFDYGFKAAHIDGFLQLPQEKQDAVYTA